MSNENTNPVTQEKVKLTYAEKLAARIGLLTKRIASDTEELEELRREEDAQAQVAQISVGWKATAVLGRAETKREVAVAIIGVKVEEDGSRKFKVAYGTGFDTETAVVGVSQLKDIQQG